MRGIYYIPIYGYRHEPRVWEVIDEAFNNYLRGEKTIIYKSRDHAEEEGRRMLCDDDTYEVFALDFSSPGSCKITIVDHHKFVWNHYIHSFAQFGDQIFKVYN